MTFAQISVDLADDSYGLLLRDYLHDRLGLRRGVAADEALVSQIIEAAEGRFVYVSFLADRFIALGRERVEPELAAATEGGRSGEALYGLWLAQLDRNFGRKEADRILQVLCVLAAAELAHGWVFGEGARPDPVDGTPLTMLSEEFAGLPLEVLATVLDSDVIDRIETDLDGNVIKGKDGSPIRKRLFDPVLLFTLERIQGVLRTSRGDAGGRRFRIGLKGLAEVMLHDEELKAGITHAQAHLASHALDLVERLLVEEAPAKPEPLERELIIALLPYAEAAVQLSGSQLLISRFQPERVIDVLHQENQRCEDEGHLSLRIGLSSLIAALQWQPCSQTLLVQPPEVQIEVTVSLQSRGNAKADRGALAEAIADYDAAIAIRQDMRKALEPMGEWEIQFRDGLASALQGRGNSKMNSGALIEALADCEEALAIQQDMREALEPAGEWSILQRKELAGSLNTRANVKLNGGALTEAIADFDAAISVMQDLRKVLEPRGGWTIKLGNQLASGLQNRGIAKADSGALHEAISDHDAAIKIMQHVREALEPAEEWTIPLRNQLAASIQNRGLAKANNGALVEAIFDYDAAISIMQCLREALEPAGEWAISLRNQFAGAIMNRAIAKAGRGELSGAITDFDFVIAVMDDIRRSLEPKGEWSLPLRKVLAESLINRGNIRSQSGALDDAIYDYDLAIAIMEDLRKALEATGDWSFPLRNDLARAFQNRGVGKRNKGALSDALSDFDAAVEIMQGMREALEPTGGWSIPLRHQLAGTLQNSGKAKANSGALGEAILNYDAAIAIIEGMREVLMPVGKWSISLQNDLALCLLNRGLAKANSGSYAEGIADYDAAIVLGQGLREAAEPAGSWSTTHRYHLAVFFYYRSLAETNTGSRQKSLSDLAKAIEILTEAIALVEESVPPGWLDQLQNWQQRLYEM